MDDKAKQIQWFGRSGVKPYKHLIKKECVLCAKINSGWENRYIMRGNFCAKCCEQIERKVKENGYRLAGAINIVRRSRAHREAEEAEYKVID
jgi:hypothetical protein